MTPYYSDDLVSLFHGDCREITDWLAADVLVTDPPYGLDFVSGWTGAAIEGDASTVVRDAALDLWQGHDGALVFGSPMLPPPRDWLIRATLIWHKPGAGMGDLQFPWRRDYEFIYVLGSGWRRSDTTRSSSVLTHVWDTFRGDAEHPHRKPLNLLRRLIACCPDGVIADPFSGTGTTLRAAKDLGRKAIGIEIDERYCEIAAKRLAQDVLDFGAAS